MARKRLKPAADGLRVPYPGGGGFLRPEGEAVIYEGARRAYWDRRLREGEVTELPDAPSGVPDEPTPDPADEATE